MKIKHLVFFSSFLVTSNSIADDALRMSDEVDLERSLLVYFQPYYGEKINEVPKAPRFVFQNHFNGGIFLNVLKNSDLETQKRLLHAFSELNANKVKSVLGPKLWHEFYSVVVQYLSSNDSELRIMATAVSPAFASEDQNGAICKKLFQMLDDLEMEDSASALLVITAYSERSNPILIEKIKKIALESKSKRGRFIANEMIYLFGSENLQEDNQVSSEFAVKLYEAVKNKDHHFLEVSLAMLQKESVFTRQVFGEIFTLSRYPDSEIIRRMATNIMIKNLDGAIRTVPN